MSDADMDDAHDALDKAFPKPNQEFTVTINFRAMNREEARITFQLMREAFCNSSRIQEIRSVLRQTDDIVEAPTS